MQNVSFKSILSGAFAMLPCLDSHPEVEDPENWRAYFLTPAGIVSGKLSSPPPKKKEERGEDLSMLELLTHGLVQASFENIGETQYTVETPGTPYPEGCIVLREVQIQPLDLTSTTEIDCMVLFTDQIVGVFAGNPTKKPLNAK